MENEMDGWSSGLRHRCIGEKGSRRVLSPWVRIPPHTPKENEE